MKDENGFVILVEKSSIHMPISINTFKVFISELNVNGITINGIKPLVPLLVTNLPVMIKNYLPIIWMIIWNMSKEKIHKIISIKKGINAVTVTPNYNLRYVRGENP